jgi:WD40 repeat protein
MPKLLLVHRGEVARARELVGELASSLRDRDHVTLCTWEQRGIAGGQLRALEAAVPRVDRVLLVNPLDWWADAAGSDEWQRSLQGLIEYSVWAGIDRFALVVDGQRAQGELEQRLPCFSLPERWDALREWLAQPEPQWVLPIAERLPARSEPVVANAAAIAVLDEAVAAARARGGFVWIRGAAGTGKSALLAAWLDGFARRTSTGREPICHVARPGIAWSCDPERVLEKLIRALLGAGFVGSHADALARLDAEQSQRAIVVIDGFEQILAQLSTEAVRRLLATGVPRYLTVIAASRPLDPGVLELQPTVDLDVADGEGENAIEGELPSGLTASLERSWTAMLARAGERRSVLRSALAILLAAPEPLPVSLLRAALREDQRAALRGLASEWLHDQGDRVGFVHASVRRFLEPELDPLDPGPHVQLLDALASLQARNALDDAAAAYAEQHGREHRLACHGFDGAMAWVTDVELLVDLAGRGELLGRLEAARELADPGRRTLVERALAVARRRSSEFIEQPAALPSQLWAELVGHGMNAAELTELMHWGTTLPPIRLRNQIRLPDRSVLRLGHGGDVRGCAIDAAAVRAITVTTDARLHIWSVRSGERLASLEIHGWGEGCAISADGTRAVVGARQRVTVWDLDAKQELAHHDDHGAEVQTVSISADGKTVLSSDRDGIVRLWQIDRDRRAQLGRHEAVVRCGAISADGRLGITGDDDRKVIVWDIERAQRIQTLPGHTYAVGGVALTATGDLAISVCIGEARVWEPRSGQLLHTYDALGESTHGCVLVDGGAQALVAESGQELHRWTVADGKLLVRHFAHGQDMTCVAATPDGKWYMTGGQDRVARVWQSASITGIDEAAYLRSITSMHASADGKSVWISGGGDGTRRVSILDGSELERLPPSGAHALAEAGARVVTGGSGRTVVVHSRSSRDEIAKWEPTNDWLRCCAVDPTGKRLAYAGDEKLVFCSDFEGAGMVRLRGHGDWIRALAWTAEGRLVSVDDDGELRFWEVDTQVCVSKCTPINSSAIYGLAVDGPRAFVGGLAGKLASVELGTGKVLVSFDGHEGAITDLALAEPGMLVSVGRDATLRIWSVDDTDAQLLARYDAAYPFTRVTAVGGKLVAGDAAGNHLILDVDWDRLRG